MDAWEAMANAMLLVRCVVVRIEVRRRLVSWVQKAKMKIFEYVQRRVTAFVLRRTREDRGAEDAENKMYLRYLP
jgi:hypothetical protein